MRASQENLQRLERASEKTGCTISEGKGNVAGQAADDGLAAAVRALVQHRLFHGDVGFLEAAHLERPLERIRVGQRMQCAFPQSLGIRSQIIDTVLSIDLHAGQHNLSTSAGPHLLHGYIHSSDLLSC